MIDSRNEVARHELACAFLKIFVPRVRGRRFIVETATEWAGVKLNVKAPVLDAFDLGVLLSIYAIAQRQVYGRNLAPGKERPGLIDEQHKGNGNGLAGEASLSVETSIGEIALMIGRDRRDGRAAKNIRAALERLAMIVLTAAQGESWGITHLLHAAAAKGGAVTIALDHRATKALIGDGQWAAISMKQWRECSGDVERVLLHRLAALTTGRPVAVKLDTLADACWADRAKDDHALRWRRQQVRDSIKAGRAVPAGFKASINAGGRVSFKRLAQIEPTEPESGCVFLTARTRVLDCAPNPLNVGAEPVPEDFPNAPEPLPLHEEAPANLTGLQAEARADRTGQQPLPIPEEVKHEQPTAEQLDARLAASMPAVSDEKRAANVAALTAKLDAIERRLQRFDHFRRDDEWVSCGEERAVERLETKRMVLRGRLRLEQLRPAARKRGAATAGCARNEQEPVRTLA